MSFGHIDIYGSTVSIDGTTIHGVFDDNIPFPAGSTATKDTSTQDSGTVMEKGLKRFDPGSVTLSGNMIPNDAGQIALFSAYTDRALHTISVTIPDAGEVYSYDGYVSTFVPGNADNTYVFSCTIEASGQPERSTTTAAITSIVASGAGVVNVPAALAADTDVLVINEANGITSATLTVTAAAASAIEISDDDGESWTALTSAEASAAITLAAGVIIERLLKVEETSKATRFVRIYIIRAAA